HGRVGCPKQPVVLEKDAIYLDYEVVLVTLEALSQLLVHMVGQNGVACRQNGWAVLNLAPEFIPPFFEGWHSVSSFMVGSINLPFAEFTKVSCVLTRLKNATSGLNSARADEAAASAPVYSAANTPIWAPSHLGSLNNINSVSCTHRNILPSAPDNSIATARADHSGQRGHYLKVIYRQQPLPSIEPLPDALLAILGTGPIATRAVPDLGDMPFRTPLHVPAQRGRVTLHHDMCSPVHAPRLLMALGKRTKRRV